MGSYLSFKFENIYDTFWLVVKQQYLYYHVQTNERVSFQIAKNVFEPA